MCIEVKRVQALLEAISWVQTRLADVTLWADCRGQVRATGSRGRSIDCGIFCLIIEAVSCRLLIVTG